MERNTNEIKIIGLTGKFPKYVIAGIMFALGVYCSAILPYRSDRYLLFSLPVGVIGFLSAIWQIRKPNSHLKYLLQVSASALIALLAYRSMSYLFPQFSLFTGLMIIFGFVFTHTLPIWNLPAAIFISDELYAPKTWVGKIVFRVAFIIGPIGGMLLGRVAAKGSGLAIFIFGIMFMYLAFLVPFIDLSRYSVRNYCPPMDDVLRSEDANLPARKSSYRQPSTSEKRISRNKKEKL